MKRKFSTAWKASSQPRKQRKYIAKAPLHLKQKLLSANLSKDLRSKYGMRNIEVRKGDTIRIMRGKFKKQSGKITEVKIKTGKIYVEKIQAKKQDGSKTNIPLKASNLQIIELNLDDKKRMKRIKKIETKEKPKKTERKIEKKQDNKKENGEEKK